jgi:anti-sigma regulatory factor (Ser/Thr protein kinase)
MPGRSTPFRRRRGGDVQAVPDVSPTADELSLTYPAELDSVPAARRAVRSFCERLDLPPRTRDDVALALTEACANAVLHASAQGAENPRFEVEARSVASGVRVVVRDFGGGIAPRLDSPGIGVGLPLIAALTDGLDLRSRGWATEVIMTFSAAGDDADPA